MIQKELILLSEFEHYQLKTINVVMGLGYTFSDATTFHLQN